MSIGDTVTLHRFKVLLPLIAVLALAACVSGSAIITGTTRTPVAPDQVKVYAEPPASFEVIGLVSASSEAGWTEQGSVNYALDELKRRAGKLGANGVLLVSTGDTTSVYNGISSAGKTVQGKAIFVAEK